MKDIWVSQQWVYTLSNEWTLGFRYLAFSPQDTSSLKQMSVVCENVCCSVVWVKNRTTTHRSTETHDRSLLSKLAWQQQIIVVLIRKIFRLRESQDEVNHTLQNKTVKLIHANKGHIWSEDCLLVLMEVTRGRTHIASDMFDKRYIDLLDYQTVCCIFTINCNPKSHFWELCICSYVYMASAYLFVVNYCAAPSKHSQDWGWGWCGWR